MPLTVADFNITFEDEEIFASEIDKLFNKLYGEGHIKVDANGIVFSKEFQNVFTEIFQTHAAQQNSLLLWIKLIDVMSNIWPEMMMVGLDEGITAENYALKARIFKDAFVKALAECKTSWTITELNNLIPSISGNDATVYSESTSVLEMFIANLAVKDLMLDQVKLYVEFETDLFRQNNVKVNMIKTKLNEATTQSSVQNLFDLVYIIDAAVPSMFSTNPRLSDINKNAIKLFKDYTNPAKHPIIPLLFAADCNTDICNAMRVYILKKMILVPFNKKFEGNTTENQIDYVALVFNSEEFLSFIKQLSDSDLVSIINTMAQNNKSSKKEYSNIVENIIKSLSPLPKRLLIQFFSYAITTESESVLKACLNQPELDMELLNSLSNKNLHFENADPEPNSFKNRAMYEIADQVLKNKASWNEKECLAFKKIILHINVTPGPNEDQSNSTVVLYSNFIKRVEQLNTPDLADYDPYLLDSVRLNLTGTYEELISSGNLISLNEALDYFDKKNANQLQSEIFQDATRAIGWLLYCLANYQYSTHLDYSAGTSQPQTYSARFAKVLNKFIGAESTQESETERITFVKMLGNMTDHTAGLENGLFVEAWNGAIRYAFDSQNQILRNELAEILSDLESNFKETQQFERFKKQIFVEAVLSYFSDAKLRANNGVDNNNDLLQHDLGVVNAVLTLVQSYESVDFMGLMQQATEPDPANPDGAPYDNYAMFNYFCEHPRFFYNLDLHQINLLLKDRNPDVAKRVADIFQLPLGATLEEADIKQLQQLNTEIIDQVNDRLVTNKNAAMKPQIMQSLVLMKIYIAQHEAENPHLIAGNAQSAHQDAATVKGKIAKARGYFAEKVSDDDKQHKWSLQNCIKKFRAIILDQILLLNQTGVKDRFDDYIERKRATMIEGGFDNEDIAMFDSNELPAHVALRWLRFFENKITEKGMHNFSNEMIQSEIDSDNQDAGAWMDNSNYMIHTTCDLLRYAIMAIEDEPVVDAAKSAELKQNLVVLVGIAQRNYNETETGAPVMEGADSPACNNGMLNAMYNVFLGHPDPRFKKDQHTLFFETAESLILTVIENRMQDLMQKPDVKNEAKLEQILTVAESFGAIDYKTSWNVLCNERVSFVTDDSRLYIASMMAYRNSLLFKEYPDAENFMQAVLHRLNDGIDSDKQLKPTPADKAMMHALYYTVVMDEKCAGKIYELYDKHKMEIQAQEKEIKLLTQLENNFANIKEELQRSKPNENAIKFQVINFKNTMRMYAQFILDKENIANERKDDIKEEFVDQIVQLIPTKEKPNMLNFNDLNLRGNLNQLIDEHFKETLKAKNNNEPNV